MLYPVPVPDDQGGPVAVKVESKLYATWPLVPDVPHYFGPFLLIEGIVCVNEEKPPVLLLDSSFGYPRRSPLPTPYIVSTSRSTSLLPFQPLPRCTWQIRSAKSLQYWQVSLRAFHPALSGGIPSRPNMLPSEDGSFPYTPWLKWQSYSVQIHSQYIDKYLAYIPSCIVVHAQC